MNGASMDTKTQAHVEIIYGLLPNYVVDTTPTSCRGANRQAGALTKCESSLSVEPSGTAGGESVSRGTIRYRGVP